MGKRKSKSIEPESPGNVPDSAQEFDVAGPLTLEEAKAVGDVPEEFKAAQSPPYAGGILKHSAPTEQDNVVPSSGDLGAPGEHKSVTFAEQPSEAINDEEKPTRRKSLLELLHLKKRKDTEPIAESQEEADETKQAEGTEVTEAMEAENAVEPSDREEPVKPKKRKSVLSSLFHRKGKEETSQENAESPEEAAQAVETAATEAEQVKQSETPGPTAEPQTTEVAEGLATEQGEEPTNATMPEEEAATEALDASKASEASPEKKSFFGRLFSKRSSRTSESGNDEAGAVAGGAVASAGVVAAGAAAIQENGEKTENDAEGSAPAQTNEEPSPPAKKKKPFWASTYPEPASDAVAMKEGCVKKKGYIFQSFRPRFMRIMSDGILQYSRKEGEWEDAKGLKLSHDMALEAQDGSGKNPYVLKVNVPGGKNCVFGFETVEDRDSWKSAFEEIKVKLQANIPDDGNQHVMKSGSLEGDNPEVPAHDSKEGVNA